MAEELRLKYNQDFVQQFAEQVGTVYTAFSQPVFIRSVLEPDWDSLSLMERFMRLAESLYDTLQLPYPQVVDILIELNQTCRGFDYLFFHNVIWRYGLDDFPTSFRAMEVLTEGSTAEYAIRYFLNQDFDRSFAFLQKLSQSPNEHHRRLASEGTRLRLPWGKSVPDLEDHLEEILALLAHLKEDPSLYVRKSVANNLNDLTKKYPDLVIQHLKEWKSENQHTDWIIKTALRTLIKSGYQPALEFLGYRQDIQILTASLEMDTYDISYGTTSQINYRLQVASSVDTKYRVSLAMGFQKANGTISEKIFHLKDTDFLTAFQCTGQKTYTWKDLTTRKHYAGDHRVRLLINDIEVASCSFQLTI